MNEEVKLLTVRIKPLVDDVAALHGIKFGPKTSDVLSRFYEHDETARFIFDFFVTASTNYQNCGGFILTNPHQLEKIHSDPPGRGKELNDNRIFAFALEGDGSFFCFGLGSRKFYNVDFCPWIGEEDPWHACLSNTWTTLEFCEYFEMEYAQNNQ